MDLKKLFAITAVAGCVMTAGCGQRDEDDLMAGGGGSKAAGVRGTASVAGRDSLSGKAPVSPNSSMGADQVCKTAHTSAVADQTVVVSKKGELANVIVYVKEGAGHYPAPATSVLLDQKGCDYKPHVFGIQVGQALEIQNSDPTLHNVHSMAS